MSAKDTAASVAGGVAKTGGAIAAGAVAGAGVIAVGAPIYVGKKAADVYHGFSEGIDIFTKAIQDAIIHMGVTGPISAGMTHAGAAMLNRIAGDKRRLPCGGRMVGPMHGGPEMGM